MFGDLGKMMELLGQLKTKLPEMQAKLAESQFTAEAGGGAVQVAVDGKLTLVNVTFDPRVLADGQTDAETLADMVTAAVRAAQDKAAEAARAAMQELTGGMELPGLDGVLG